MRNTARVLAWYDQLADDSDFIRRACPLCGGDEFAALEIGEPVGRVGHNVLCANCGLIYQNPVMTLEAMARFYESEYVTNYRDSEQMARSLAAGRVRLLKQHVDMSAISPELEIGSAYGAYLVALRDEGVEVAGVEPSREMADSARREHGLAVTASTYEATPESRGRYGSVHLFHVLEHVLDPLAITGVYDADPGKQGGRLLGHVIEPPEALREFHGDAVIVSSYAFQEEIVEQLSYLRGRGVDLVTLYDKG